MCVMEGTLRRSARRPGAGSRRPDAAARRGIPSPLRAADLAPHPTVLRSDSLRERPPPQPRLERAAEYVAEEFARLGLTPWETAGPLCSGIMWRASCVRTTATPPSGCPSTVTC